MDYLNLSRKALAWHFIQDPKTLIATFEQWLAFLNDGQKGILRVINLTNAMRLIIDAMELAKEHVARRLQILRRRRRR